MRSREKISRNMEPLFLDNNARLIFEVLLDIRELLINAPQTKQVQTLGESIHSSGSLKTDKTVDPHSKVKAQHKAIGEDANKGIDNLNKKYRKNKNGGEKWVMKLKR